MLNSQPLTAKIEEFFDNSQYKLKIRADENCGKNSNEGNMISLAIYFYPKENLLERTNEFNELFEKYCIQLKIPIKKTYVGKAQPLIHQYVLNKSVIEVGYSIPDSSYYLKFVDYGKGKKISQTKIKKIKDLFKKFRLLLEAKGCKDKKLDYLVNKLSRHWVLEHKEGLSFSEELELSFKTNPKKTYVISFFDFDVLVNEHNDAKQDFEKHNLDTTNSKEISELIEKVNEITRPLSVLLDRRVTLPEKLKTKTGREFNKEEIIKEIEEYFDKYKAIREDLLKRLEEDPEQVTLENQMNAYKEGYIEILSKLNHCEEKKEKQQLIREAKKIAKKFNYNPEKDLTKYL